MTTSPYLGDLASQLSAPQRRLAAWAINQHGVGDHPWAEPDRLRGFSTSYLLGCLENGASASHAEGNPIRAVRCRDLIDTITTMRCAASPADRPAA